MSNVHNPLTCNCNKCEKYWEEFKANAIVIKPLTPPTGEVFKMNQPVAKWGMTFK